MATSKKVKRKPAEISDILKCDADIVGGLWCLAHIIEEGGDANKYIEQTLFISNDVMLALLKHFTININELYTMTDKERLIQYALEQQEQTHLEKEQHFFNELNK
jgi:hypothetical protein